MFFKQTAPRELAERRAVTIVAVAIEAATPASGRLDEAQQATNRVLRIDPGFRLGAWRQRSLLTAECRERYAQRLRLAGLPE